MESARKNRACRTNARVLLRFAILELVLVVLSPAQPQNPAHQVNAGGAGTANDESRKATPGVSFREETLGEGDSVYVETWFANDTASDFTQVNLQFFGPDFLEWHDKDCSGPAISNSLPLTAPTRHSFVEHRFCIMTKPGSQIKVGDFNILFLYSYEWKEGGTLRKSIASVEKPLKIVLLGNDNLVGIPLSIAGLVVPGLFFWFAVGLWKAPWGVGLALGEKLFYSLICSAIFVAVGTWLSEISWLPHSSWILTMDVLQGISLAKLGQLAVMGMVVGAIAGGGDKWIRRTRRMNRLARTINPDDPTEVLLEKLLNTHPNRRKPLTTVRLKDNSHYSGSLGAQTGDTDEDTTVVVGWFAYPSGKFPGNSEKQAKLYVEQNRLADLLDLARGKKVPIETIDAVKGEGGQTTGQDSMRWKNDQVAAFEIEDREGPREPLVLK